MPGKFRRTRLNIRLALTLALVILLAGPATLPAQETAPGSTPLSVAVAECPPFVMVNNGQYSGLGIYLWERVGQELGVTWEYREYPLGRLLESLGDIDNLDPIDIGISCISVTAERERLIDFSHSFTETHTAIAVRQPGIGAAILGFLSSSKFWKAIGVILAVALVIGLVFFWLEHDKNKKLFSTQTRVGRSLETMIIGLLFATNGPLRYYRFKTLTARVLSTVLALSSTLLIASVTAVIASSLTLSSLQNQVTSLNDLRTLRVGALEASTSSEFLAGNRIAHQTRPSLDHLITDLDAGELDAIVSDAAFLQYRILKGQEQGQFKSLAVLPLELEFQNYAFVLDLESAYREDINRTLLSVRKEDEWRELVKRFLGE